MRKIVLSAFFIIMITSVLSTQLAASNIEAPSGISHSVVIPRETSSYDDASMTSLRSKFVHRAAVDPLNAVATLIFACAICHMFMAQKLHNLAYSLDEKYRKKHAIPEGAETIISSQNKQRPVSVIPQLMYFLGEVEVIFLLWAIPLTFAITFLYNWETASTYIDNNSFREPLFVVVIMTLASTRPILNFVAKALHTIARIFNSSPLAWWFIIMTVGPLFGSVITEPGAITISAILLSRQFYRYTPSTKFAYATMGLLFVNVSVGGVLTHFAAPPVLMVAHVWHWDTPFMFMTFGWKVIIGILLSNTAYAYWFRKEFARIKLTRSIQQRGDILSSDSPREVPVPLWITLVHFFVMFWTIYNENYPSIFIGMFLLFIGFHHATRPYQDELSLKSPVLIGCFLSGLIIHGGLQGWWIDVVLDSLGSTTMLLTTTVMTAFNDNAAITYLCTFNTHFTDPLKYAAVAGAIAGGGLTVMANAPNPAGQLLLKKYFHQGIAPLHLFFGAALPTVIQVIGLMFLPSIR